MTTLNVKILHLIEETYTVMSTVYLRSVLLCPLCKCKEKIAFYPLLLCLGAEDLMDLVSPRNSSLRPDIATLFQRDRHSLRWNLCI